ncbi:hypothetical protein SADUNF_Sadunf11G0121100 [Salix dunnii]|uniref:Uncharacterized protein n=1 Tax=Salix dunnii TaxID=1413687 RepID=A0A835MQW8_9ROSI|nr:hypothetical protein SADUNF_Sadunf11G0121100 [Salix dunnii]
MSMEASAAALWVERIAFLLLSCITSIESRGILFGAVLGLLAASNLLYRCAMEEKATTAVKLEKLHKNGNNSDSRINIEQSDVKSSINKEKKAVAEDELNNKATSCEGGEDSTMKSKLIEILKKATDNCDAEKLSNNWHEMVVSKLEDELKKHRALGEEELIRKARGGCEEEFKRKLKIKEEELEAKHDEERRQWEKERKVLKEKYEMMRWT